MNEINKFLSAPTGKPTITTAHNTSANSLYISWRPPYHDTIHGEFLGYRISYRPREQGAEAVQEIYIRDSSVEVFYSFILHFSTL